MRKAAIKVSKTPCYCCNGASSVACQEGDLSILMLHICRSEPLHTCSSLMQELRLVLGPCSMAERCLSACVGQGDHSGRGNFLFQFEVERGRFFLGDRIVHTCSGPT